MKTRTLFSVSLFFLLSLRGFAQTSQILETNLLKSFKKINYWTVQVSKDTTDTLIDSLASANDDFRSILGDYSIKYPFTICLPYHSLKNAGLGILSSTDGLIRIYSWDMGTGVLKVR